MDDPQANVIVMASADSEVFVVDFANGWRFYMDYRDFPALAVATPEQRQQLTFTEQAVAWPVLGVHLSAQALIEEQAAECDPGSYHQWMHNKVKASLDDPRPGIPHDEVMAEMAALLASKMPR